MCELAQTCETRAWMLMIVSGGNRPFLTCEVRESHGFSNMRTLAASRASLDIESVIGRNGPLSLVRNEIRVGAYFSSSFLPAFKLSKFKIALNTRK